MRCIKNRKGDATDPLIFLVILFFLAVSFIVVIFINTKLNNVITDTVLNDTAASASINQAFENVNSNAVQRGFVLIFAIMVMFIMGSAFLIRVHPVFIFIYILTLAITIFGAIFIGNTFDKLNDNSLLADVLTEQSKISFIMDNIVKITMAVGGLSMLIIFAKIVTPPINTGSPI